jgi:hypothetical protein
MNKAARDASLQCNEHSLRLSVAAGDTAAVPVLLLQQQVCDASVLRFDHSLKVAAGGALVLLLHCLCLHQTASAA